MKTVFIDEAAPMTEQQFQNLIKLQYLNRYKTACKQLDRLREQLEMARSQAERITPSLSGMPPAGVNKPIEGAVEKIMDIEAQIAEKREEVSKKADEILEYLASIKDTQSRAFLKYAYVLPNGTINKAAQRCNIPKTTAYRLHDRLINELAMPPEGE